MADPALLSSIYGTRKQARELRQSAQEGRAVAQMTMAHARRLCRRAKELDEDVALASGAAQLKRKLILRDESLNALRQSLKDLESLRMVLSSDDPAISKLKADIRKTLKRPA